MSLAAVKRSHLIIVLLLLPLLARSMLPSGFMWGSGPDSARIIFCPEWSVPLAAQSEHAAYQQAGNHAEHHQHADHHGSNAQDHDHQSQAHAGSQCPFAVAAVTAPPTFFAGIVSFVSVSSEDIAPLPAQSAGLISWRAHSIRGPPALS